MGFMDKLKETAGKAAEKAGAMKDSAMDSYGKMKEANEQKKAEKQAYTAAMEQEVKEYSEKLIESITAAYADGGAKFWGEGNRAAIDKFTKDYYEMLVLPGSRPNISCLTMSPYIDEKAMKKFADKGGVDLQGAVPHILLKMAMMLVWLSQRISLHLNSDMRRTAVSGLRARFRQPVSIHL